MVEAEALAPEPELLALDFDVSDFDASDFIESLGEADGGELGLELDGEEDCARADESINPLSAVVINNFLSIDKPPCMWRLVVMASGTAFRLRFGKKPASTHQRLMCDAVPR